MKQPSSFLFPLAFLGLLASCSTPVEPGVTSEQPTSLEEITSESLGDPVYDGNPVSVSHVVNNGKLTYLEVDGSPFLMLGAQIRADAFRNCDHYKTSDLAPLFDKAAELGLTAIQIPVQWADIEVGDGVFDYAYLDQIMSMANERNLKLELLWFGSNMCGDTHSYSTPGYILKDGRTYPKLDAKRTGEFWNYYGIQWYLEYDNPNLLQREGDAITKALDHVYEYDSYHGGKKPVIGIQIENEPDIFPRWRLEQYGVLDRETGQRMTEEVAWNKVYTQIDELGKAAKRSKYQIYTRVNFAGVSTGHGIYDGSAVKTVPSWARHIYELEGIDAIGDDPYKSLINDIQGISAMLGEKLPGNLSIISENDGKYGNTPSLMLTALANNAFYEAYELATSPFYIEHQTSSGVDQGIYQVQQDGSLTARSHVQKTKDFIEIAKLGKARIPLTEPKNFAAFNLESDSPKENVAQTINTTKVSLTFSTDSGAIGYALDDGEGSILLAATEASNVSFANATIASIQELALDENGNATPNKDLTVSSSLNLEKGKGYLVNYSNASTILSTTWEAIGK